MKLNWQEIAGIALLLYVLGWLGASFAVTFGSLVAAGAYRYLVRRLRQWRGRRQPADLSLDDHFQLWDEEFTHADD